MGFPSPLLSPHTSPFSLSPRYCTLVLLLGVVHDLVGHRHQANAFLQTPPATGRHKLSRQLRRACQGPAESAAGFHPQILLQTKMVSSYLDLGFFRCQEAQMRLPALPTTWSRSQHLSRCWGPPGPPSWPQLLQEPVWRGSLLPCPCNSCCQQQMAKYYHTYITFTSKRAHNWVEIAFPCQHLFIKWHMYTWHLPFYMQHY